MESSHPKTQPRSDARSPITAVTTPMKKIDTTKHTHPAANVVGGMHAAQSSFHGSAMMWPIHAPTPGETPSPSSSPLTETAAENCPAHDAEPSSRLPWLTRKSSTARSASERTWSSSTIVTRAMHISSEPSVVSSNLAPPVAAAIFTSKNSFLSNLLLSISCTEISRSETSP